MQQDAAAALKAAKTVRVTGATLSQGRRVRLDLRLQDGRSSGVVMLTGAQAEFTAIGSDFYLKGNQQAWQALLAPPPVEGFAGQWVKLRSEQVTLDLISIESLAAQLTDNAWRLQPKVEQATLGDRKVVVLSQQDGSRLYVANTGPAHPLRIDDRKPDGWQVDLAEHGADLQVAAPSNSLSNGLTPAESAWLDKVEKLTATMEKAFEAIPTYLSASALTTAATRLRGCNQELARIGSPSYPSSQSMRWRSAPAPNTRRGRSASPRPLALASHVPDRPCRRRVKTDPVSPRRVPAIVATWRP